MTLRWSERERFRWLDFDIENRPLNYGPGDWTGADITAIAWGWVGEKRVHVRALGEVTTEEMLTDFLAAYNEAGGVTGHYIRNHDLPIVNGALMEFGLPTLGPKLSCDTKNDLIKRKDLSASQESLAETLGIAEAKYHMSQPKWRKGNRLTPEGIALTKKRVVDDVVQHKALREALLERRWLKPPKVWAP